MLYSVVDMMLVSPVILSTFGICLHSSHGKMFFLNQRWKEAHVEILLLSASSFESEAQAHLKSMVNNHWLWAYGYDDGVTLLSQHASIARVRDQN